MKPNVATATALVLLGCAAAASVLAQAVPAASSPPPASPSAPPSTLSAPADAAPARPAGVPATNATQACEQAVRNTLRSTRGAAAEVTFNAPPVAAGGSAEGGDMLLRGAGRARSGNSARTFTYSCTYDARANSVAGVVLRDAASAGDRPAVAAPVRTVEPDLSQISPQACESAAATALKRRWPNVGRIAFSANTRSLQQDSAGTAKLEGQGTVQQSVGAEQSTHFSYQCALEARTGRVLALRLND